MILYWLYIIVRLFILLYEVISIVGEWSIMLLRDVFFIFEGSEFVGVVGFIGFGKLFFLRVIVGEFDICYGCIFLLINIVYVL